MRSTIELSYDCLKPWCIAYVALPVLIFMLSWVKLVVGVPIAILLAIASADSCLHWSMRFNKRVSSNSFFSKPVDFYNLSPKKLDKPVTIKKWVFLLFIFIALIWCLLGGQGGFWAQNDDWSTRNAIFRDLIMHDWPVRYGNGSALSYYISFWLPAAVVGRFLMLMGIGADLVWRLANIALLIWSTAGIMLVFLLAVVTIGTRNTKVALLAILMLIFFSTPDIIGVIGANRWSKVLPVLHLEWWAQTDAGKVGQFSSITTCLFWVFNQAIIPWICTLCFLNERSFRSYFLLWLCCFSSGPMPSIGLAFLMLVQGIGVLLYRIRSHQKIAPMLVGIFSFCNIISVFSIPIIASFFFANSAVSNPEADISVGGLLPYPLWLPSTPKQLVVLLLFIIVEGVLIVALAARGNIRKPAYIGVALTLLFFPFFRIGYGLDFCMRGSIPAIITLYIFCCRNIFDHLNLKRQALKDAPDSSKDRSRAVCSYVLAAILLLGAITPIFEFYRGFYQVAQNGIAASQPDKGTLEGSDLSTSNFGTDKPEGSLFYKYLSME